MKSCVPRTDNERGDVADHLAEPWVRNMFQKQSENRFEQHVVAPCQRRPQTVSVDEFLYQRERRRWWYLL